MDPTAGSNGKTIGPHLKLIQLWILDGPPPDFTPIQLHPRRVLLSRQSRDHNQPSAIPAVLLHDLTFISLSHCFHCQASEATSPSRLLMSQVAAVPAPSLGFVKMEERKRVATSEEAAPPAKRQATMANGPTSDEKAEPIKFGALMSPWQVELDVRTFDKRLALYPFCSSRLTLSFSRRLSKRMLLYDKCARTSAKKSILSSNWLPWKRTQNIMTVIFASSMHGSLRYIHCIQRSPCLRC